MITPSLEADSVHALAVKDPYPHPLSRRAQETFGLFVRPGRIVSKQPLRFSTVPDFALPPAHLAPPTDDHRIHDARDDSVHSAEDPPAYRRCYQSHHVGVEAALDGRSGCAFGVGEGEGARGADPASEAEGEGCDEACCAEEEERQGVRMERGPRDRVAGAEIGRLGSIGCEERHASESPGGGGEGLRVDGAVGEGQRVGGGSDRRKDDGVRAYPYESEDAAREDQEWQADDQREEGGEADGAK